MGTTRNNYFAHLEFTGYSLDVSCPHILEHICRNQKLCCNLVTIGFYSIMTEQILTSMPCTNAQHNMGCFMYNGEHLGRLAVCTVYKNIRRSLVYKGKPTTFTDFQGSVRVITHHAVKGQKNTCIL